MHTEDKGDDQRPASSSPPQRPGRASANARAFGRAILSVTSVVAAVVACFLAWLWVSARMGSPQRWYRSDDRSCFYIGCDLDDAGGTLFRVHFDCGPDVRLFQPEDFDRFGVLYRAINTGGWQFVDAGVRLWAAAPLLGSVLLLAFLRRPVRAFVRSRRGACLRCGHLLAGADRCAECGTSSVQRTKC